MGSIKWDVWDSDNSLAVTTESKIYADWLAAQIGGKVVDQAEYEPQRCGDEAEQ